ncbi:nitrile hydratase subunit alpha [Aeromicrobium sp. CFBP 8757]|uniref:nitrile hydratase subunit alpha n=1 Tax=Aeromicrobium sp. CFBP 8757 TaxID=2775288 RepID=UPI00177E8095|nr:nitrile hydratase subunit alpha [Aeromicrobium sp. CFBP 8757]MBD8605397.1 nitrile hydratase subunit alpha [Aeromicrobium sp. CFBP 8757]
MGHDHDHDHDHGTGGHHPGELSDGEVRARALESLFREKGLVKGDVIDDIIDAYTHDIGPLNGARAVAKAWVDPEYHERLLADATAALLEIGVGGLQGEHMIAVQNTDDVHNVVVCTLCSCYPWPVLGLPPRWYKDAPYRARVVREPRAVLADFGTTLPDDTSIRVWDSSAEIRYLVVPQRPAGTDSLSEEELVSIITRDSMIGVTLPDASATQVSA